MVGVARYQPLGKLQLTKYWNDSASASSPSPANDQKFCTNAPTSQAPGLASTTSDGPADHSSQPPISRGHVNASKQEAELQHALIPLLEARVVLYAT